MTDLLGVCTAWGDSECVVQPEQGPPVTIRLADVVSGKPVPPRPSPRHRVSPRAAEEHGRVLWPGVTEEPLGDWLLRSEPEPRGRLRKRANSALALGDPGLPLPRAAARVVDFYRARGREVLVQVEADGAVGAWFDAAGWTVVEGGAATFWLGSTSRALRTCGQGSRDAVGEVRLVEDPPRVEALVELDGRPVAGGHAAHDGDWLGVHGLTVEPDHRRRGLATAVMAALLDWGAAHGATTTWLHVETDNRPAQELYARLGLAPHHDLRYLRPPG